MQDKKIPTMLFRPVAVVRTNQGKIVRIEQKNTIYIITKNIFPSVEYIL